MANAITPIPAERAPEAGPRPKPVNSCFHPGDDLAAAPALPLTAAEELELADLDR
ncbi:hypothetical protein ACQPZX_16415 [Actinoplanes sp. CA-142083]|uniref:hypothetical protein n=1 Tax=Actinoplanes sp. CA-142083 TaxID=3239903 RepID=UPI003D926F74